MPNLQCHDTRIYYQARGQGRPVLFLHGYPQTQAIWTPLIENFGEDFRLVAIDLPGFGQSEKSPTATYFYAQQVSRVLAFMQAIFTPPVDIVSHDYGSLLALGLCAQHPTWVRSLVVSNCRGHRTFRQPWYSLLRSLELLAQTHLGRWSLMHVGLGPLSRYLVESDYQGTPRARCDPDLMQPAGVRALIRFYQQGYKTQADPSFAAQLKTIKTPTLILWGQRDRYLQPRIAIELHQLLTHSQLEIYPEGCHYLIEQFPQRVLAAIRTFLAAT